MCIVAPQSWKMLQIYLSELPTPSKLPRETKVGYSNHCRECGQGCVVRGVIRGVVRGVVSGPTHSGCKR